MTTTMGGKVLGCQKRRRNRRPEKRGAMKRAEAEAKAAEADNGEAPSQEALFKKANDAKNEAKLKEIQEVQRQDKDRMAQVKHGFMFQEDQHFHVSGESRRCQGGK